MPAGPGDAAALGLLWVAIVFTAMLGLTRAFVAEREQGLLDALVLAPCDRSAIWLGKTLAVLAFLGLAELVALPAFARSSPPSAADGRGGRARGHRHLRRRHALGAMAVAGRARELLLPLLFLPLAIPIVVGGVGASVGAGGRYLGFLALYDAIFALLAWAAFEYVVAETERRELPWARATDSCHRIALRRLAAAAVGLIAAAIALIFFYAPTDADQGFSQRIFYFHVPIALTAYACFGWGAWKALR